MQEAANELDYVNENREIFGTIVNAIIKGDIPIRVTHNDTKLNNVLFDRKSNIPRCLIDLDTVMSGSILYDIADAIRSGATKNEIALLPIAIQIMPFELGMRYLTDYFDGDKYFGIINPDDNLVRARVQFALAKEIDKNMAEIIKIVDEVFK